MSIASQQFERFAAALQSYQSGTTDPTELTEAIDDLETYILGLDNELTDQVNAIDSHIDRLESSIDQHKKLITDLESNIERLESRMDRRL